jgi:hypothetical protein
VEQTNPEIKIGDLWLSRHPSASGFKLSGRLYNPGSVEIHLVRVRAWLDLNSGTKEEADLDQLDEEFRLIKPHSYFPLKLMVHTTTAKDSSYWPTEVLVEIYYVAGGQPKNWRNIYLVEEAFVDNKRILVVKPDHNTLQEVGCCGHE